MCVLTPSKTGGGASGISLLLELLDFLLQKFHDVEPFSAGLWYLIA